MRKVTCKPRSAHMHSVFMIISQNILMNGKISKWIIQRIVKDKLLFSQVKTSPYNPTKIFDKKIQLKSPGLCPKLPISDFITNVKAWASAEISFRLTTWVGKEIILQQLSDLTVSPPSGLGKGFFLFAFLLGWGWWWVGGWNGGSGVWWLGCFFFVDWWAFCFALVL